MDVLKRTFFAFFLGAFLLLTACGGETQPVGEQRTDREPETGRTDPVKPGVYSPEKNLIDPNGYEFFETALPELGVPFNKEYITRNGIRAITIFGYTQTDNELQEDSQEAALQISRRYRLSYDGAGTLTNYQRVLFFDGKGEDSTNYDFAYDASGEPTSITETGRTFDETFRRETAFTYENGKLKSRTKVGAASVFYNEDPANNRRYELHVAANGRAEVHVRGKNADLTDATALKLQEEIFLRASPFVDYAKGPNLVGVRMFAEENDKPVRVLNMPVNGEIESVTKVVYNEFGNPESREFNWEKTDQFRFRRSFKYDGDGNYVKTVYQDDRPGEEPVNKVEAFEYDKDGMWTKRTQNIKRGNNPIVVEELQFVRYEKGTPETQPGEALPGGAN